MNGDIDREAAEVAPIRIDAWEKPAIGATDDNDRFGLTDRRNGDSGLRRAVGAAKAGMRGAGAE